MSKQHEHLIKELSKDLKQSNSRRLFSPITISFIWVSAALLLTGAWIYWVQPFRYEFLEQVLSTPLFFTELVFGFFAISLICIGAFKSAVPGESQTLLKVGVVCYLLWLAIILSGYLSPILPPTMSGARDECSLETVYYGLALVGVTALLMRRRYTFQPLITAPFVAFLVVTVPAYLMQMACIYEVHHAFSHHLVPAWITAVVLSPVLYWLFKKDV